MLVNWRKALCWGALLASMLGAGDIAHAAEGIVLAGPLGGADIGAAILPPAGLYGAFGYSYFQGTKLTDGNGTPFRDIA